MLGNHILCFHGELGPICFMFAGFFKKLRLITWKNHVVGQIVSSNNVSKRIWVHFPPRNPIYLGGNLSPFAFEKLQVHFPKGMGETWINPLLPKEIARLLRKTCLKNLLKSYIYLQRCLWKKIWEKKIKPLGLNVMILTIAP